MKENFPYWTSGNKEIDELIQYTQLNATQACDYLEWIPFEKFEMVKYIGRGGFSVVYSALWMEGPRWIWDDGAQEWTRAGPMNVALKRLDNSQNISSSYIDRVLNFLFSFSNCSEKQIRCDKNLLFDRHYHYHYHVMHSCIQSCARNHIMII